MPGAAIGGPFDHVVVLFLDHTHTFHFMMPIMASSKSLHAFRLLAFPLLVLSRPLPRELHALLYMAILRPKRSSLLHTHLHLMANYYKLLSPPSSYFTSLHST